MDRGKGLRVAALVVLALLLIAFAPGLVLAFAAGAAFVAGAAFAAAGGPAAPAAAGGPAAFAAAAGGAEGRPPRPPFDLSDFSQTPETWQYSPRGDQILQEICAFRRVAGGRGAARAVRRVVDATAHVGVDTATLARAFPAARVTAVERDPAVFRLLEENVAKLGLGGRVEAVLGSGRDYLEGAPPADLVYMDPPWGGRGYGVMDDLPLTGPGGEPEESLAPVVEQALRVAPLVVLKAPHNFDFAAFEEKLAAHVVGVARVKYRDPARKRAAFVLLEIRKAPCRERRAAPGRRN